jgi:hypothetical protein
MFPRIPFQGDRMKLVRIGAQRAIGQT